MSIDLSKVTRMALFIGSTEVQAYDVTISPSGTSSEGTGGQGPVTVVEPSATLDRDLPALLAVPGSKVCLRRGARYDVKDLTITGSRVMLTDYGDPALPPPVLFYGGNGLNHYQLTAAANDVIIRGIQFQSELTEKHSRANAVEIKGHNATVQDCTWANVGNAVQCAGKWSNLRVVGTRSLASDSIAGYGLWFEGLNGFFGGNTILGSLDQHLLRATGLFNGLEISDNIFTTINKGVTIQAGSNCKILRNHITGGGLGIGPLGNVNPDGTPWTVGQGPITERTDTVWIESNTLVGVQFDLWPGCQNVIVDSNTITRNGEKCISVQAYSTTFQRGVANVTISNNTGINGGIDGNFMRGGAGAVAVSVHDNIYRAPNLKVGDAGSCPVYLEGADTTGYSFAKNIWQLPIAYGWLARDSHPNGPGQMHVGLGEAQSTWVNGSQWEVMTRSGDLFLAHP